MIRPVAGPSNCRWPRRWIRSHDHGHRAAGDTRRGGEPGGEPCPVEPNRPLDQSGGAAAALEFGD